MDERQRAGELGERLLREAAELRQSRPQTAAWRDLRLVEMRGSLALSGIVFSPRDLRRLVEDGAVAAGRSLEHCNAAADYAAAAAHVRLIGRSRPHRGLVRLEDIVAVHALATRRALGERPGKWRSATAPALRSGVVPPPAWLVPRSMSAFVERFEGGPLAQRPLVAWLADYYERFTRINPFATANGRVARLLLNLVLQRLGLPPLVLLGGDGKALAAALDRAGAGDLWPSALFFGKNLLRSIRTLQPEATLLGETLLPLARISAPQDVAALYKAAQRGRLRTIRKGTGILTSKTWLDEYRSSQAPAGRPRRRPTT